MSNDNATLGSLAHTLSIAEADIKKLSVRPEFDRLRVLFDAMNDEVKDVSKERWFS